MVKDVTGVESKVIRFPGGSSNTVSKQYCPGLMTTLTKAVQEKDSSTSTGTVTPPMPAATTSL